MNELFSAIELAIEYGQQLRAVQPGHELLRYLTELDNTELNNEFENRFWSKPFSREGQPGYLVNATIWANYAVALAQALEQLSSPAITGPVGEKGIAQVG